MKISLEDAITRYGAIENGTWNDEAKWCKVLTVPPELVPYLVNAITKQPTHHIYCNIDMFQALLSALGNIEIRGLKQELKSFDGCFMIRDVRSEPSHPSCHSYALAIDLNAATNELGTDGDISDELAKCFLDVGFTWGKTFHRRDPMHFSYAWE